MSRHLLAVITFMVMLTVNQDALASSRIKDIAHIKGLKKEMVIGYGLVVGLDGTGDGNKATFTAQSLEAMLERFGISVEANEFKVANVAAVLVTAEIFPFMSVGSQVDVVVSSVGDASSLSGGMLLATPLLGMDGRVYALAQGAMSLGGFNVNAGGNNSIVQNHSTVGMVVSGGIVQIAPEQTYIENAVFELVVDNFDFQTVSSMVSTINAIYGDGVARGTNGRTVKIHIPVELRADPVGFIGEMQRLNVEVDVRARVVINERTGTIVIGTNVQVGEAAIAHGNLSVEISTRLEATAAAPGTIFGETVVVPNVKAIVHHDEASIIALKDASTVGSIADALNQVGVTPRDIIAIFQALKRAGALRAELVVI